MNKEHNKYEATLCRLLPELSSWNFFFMLKVNTYLRYESMVYALFRIVFYKNRREDISFILFL